MPYNSDQEPLKWYLAEIECPICGNEQIDLHPELSSDAEGLECEGCGYMIAEADNTQEVPESFARAEHQRLGLYWGKDGIDGEYDSEKPKGSR